eukprot:jgi/Phyca11/504859/fgenesh2_kg.PHYCAscaffold_10_\
MEGKRGNDTDDNVDAKRAKTEFPLELVLNGEEYINLALLFKTTPFDAYFNKHYKTVKRFLEKETKVEVYNVTKTNVARHILRVQRRV